MVERDKNRERLRQRETKAERDKGRERQRLTGNTYVLTRVFGATTRRGHRDRDVKEMEEGEEEEEEEEERVGIRRRRPVLRRHFGRRNCRRIPIIGRRRRKNICLCEKDA